MRTRNLPWHRALAIGVIAGVSLTAACGADQPQEQDSSQIDQELSSVLSTATQKQEASAATPTPTTDDLIARLEARLGSLTYDHPHSIMLEMSKRLPDWGGYYLGEDGKYYVYMTNPVAGEGMDRDIAAALSSFVWGHTIDHSGNTEEQRLSLTAEDIVIVKGRYTMLQLLDWYWLSDFVPVLGRPDQGVTGIGISGDRLFLDLASEEYRDKALASLRELDIPEEAVDISVTGPAFPDVGPPDLWERTQTLRAGSLW